MNDTTVPEFVDIGNTCEAAYATFKWGDHHRLVVGLKDMDFLDFLDKFNGDHKRADFHNDDDYGQFYVFWVADCFDPPLYIVRANGFETAYDVFTYTFYDAVKIEPPDLDDYDADSLRYNDDGKPFNSEGIEGREIELITVHMKAEA